MIDKIIDTDLKDCKEVTFKKFPDGRGYLMPLPKEDFKKLGFKRFAQFTESNSSMGVLRGMHFQEAPYEQAKLVSVVRGRALDVVIDCRVDSPTYGDWTAVELNSKDRNMLFVPRGFAHGFLSLEDDTTFQYFVDNQYQPKAEDGIAYNDPKLDIPWDKIMEQYGITDLQLSDKDKVRHDIDGNRQVQKEKQKKILVTGYSGQVGYDVVRELEERGHNRILALTSKDLDITNRDAVMDVVKWYKPDVIIHCAAWTQVDDAEIAKNAFRVIEVNVDGTRNLVDASIDVDAKIIYVSTDYVFDGTKKEPYTEEDETKPMSMYGETKYEGEEEVKRNPKHFIARTSSVFGLNGNNFVKTMLGQAAKGKEEVMAVEDQVSSPTYSKDLANTLVEMAYCDDPNKFGIYNVTNKGACSKAEFVEHIYKSAGKNVRVKHVTTPEWLKITGRKEAYRPACSILDNSKREEAGFGTKRSWEDALDAYIEELRKSIKLSDQKLGLSKKRGK